MDHYQQHMAWGVTHSVTSSA